MVNLQSNSVGCETVMVHIEEGRAYHDYGSEGYNDGIDCDHRREGRY